MKTEMGRGKKNKRQSLRFFFSFVNHKVYDGKVCVSAVL